MSISAEEQQVISHEEEILKTTIESLRAQRSAAVTQLQTENKRARELTAEIVRSRRVEDKAMAASDEAVAHALADKKTRDVGILDKQINRPYFARFEVEEQTGGRPSSIEYKLGFSANSDCRIMDWRRAPVSKLYYEYQEGDTYSEEIQGRERNGRVTLRNAVEISGSQLKRVSSTRGTFVHDGSVWHRSGSGDEGSFHHRKGGLPHILSLITPEQFKTITEEHSTPLFIQGIAGSGKTTVALHRVAWLLHKDNFEMDPDECVVIVLNPTLKSYISGTLPAMGIEGVRVLTFGEWASLTLSRVLPATYSDELHVRRPAAACPRSLERVYRSMALLRALENSPALSSPAEHLSAALCNPKALIELDDTRLLSRELVEQARARFDDNLRHDTADPAVDALLLRAYQLTNHAVALFNGSTGRFKHIVVDEVQDLGPAALACVVDAVDQPQHLTLVGDTDQRLSADKTFPGWDQLRAQWHSKDLISRFLKLKISHRSTVQIMRLADYVQGRSTKRSGREGRVPLWFRCTSEQQAIAAAIGWLKQATERYPNALSAAICPDADQARQLYGMLHPSLGNILRLGVDEHFSFGEGAVVTHVNQVRGLEFVNVLVWNAGDKWHDSGEESRNSLYMVLTRAADNLCIVSSGRPSSLLPPSSSGLVRLEYR